MWYGCARKYASSAVHESSRCCGRCWDAGVALAREGVPMCVYSMGLAGATAPVTVAGAVAQANAEILSSIVIFQLVYIRRVETR